MGYFSSLMQQSGLRGSPANRRRGAYPNEAHEAQILEPRPSVAAPWDFANASRSQSVPRAPEGFPRQEIAEEHLPVRTPIKETAVVKNSARNEKPTRTEVTSPTGKGITSVASSIPAPALSRSVQETTANSTEESISTSASPITPPEHSSGKPVRAVTDSAAITFADVRAWVSVDTDDGEEDKEQPLAKPLLGGHTTERGTTGISSGTDGYSLEIGSIEVIVEPAAPSVPAPQVPLPRPAPDHSWTLPSRHYLR